jgi:hypothetical protein
MTWFYNRAAAMEFAGEFWNRPCRSDTQPFALGMDGGRDVPLSKYWDQRKAPSKHYEPLFVFSTLFGKDQLVAKPKPGAPRPVSHRSCWWTIRRRATSSRTARTTCRNA